MRKTPVRSKKQTRTAKPNPAIAAGPARARKVRCDATIEALPAAARKMLFVKLGGEQVTDPDGGRAAEWMLKDGVEYIKRTYKRTISMAALSTWFKVRRAEEITRLHVEIQTKATLAYMESRGDEVNLREMADMSIVTALAKVVGGEASMDECAKFLGACAALKREETDRQKLQQRVREFEESTAKLRAQIEQLREAIKSGKAGRGLTKDDNQYLVAKVDELVGLCPRQP